MSRNPRLTRPPITAWQVETLRVSAFPTPDATVTPDAWWKDVMGTEAEIETIQKGRLVRQERGDALGGVVELAVRPGRIDWVLVPKVTELPETVPSLGSFTESLPRLVDLVQKWVPASPSLGRFALGVNAFVPAESHGEAYGLLDALLPAVEVDPNSSDLQYRVNRPRVSKLGIEGLRLNRLVTWSAIRMEFMTLVGGSQQTVRMAPLFAARVELDINTVADFRGPLPLERVADLTREFADLAADILVNGDQP